MRLGVHGVRRQVRERLVHAVDVAISFCTASSEVAFQKKFRNLSLRFWRTTWLTPL